MLVAFNKLLTENICGHYKLFLGYAPNTLFLGIRTDLPNLKVQMINSLNKCFLNMETVAGAV